MLKGKPLDQRVMPERRPSADDGVDDTVGLRTHTSCRGRREVDR